MHPQTADESQKALKDFQPGDTIVLDAGKTYAGSFTAPVKSNPEHIWIYIQSSKLPIVKKQCKLRRVYRKRPASTAVRGQTIVWA